MSDEERDASLPPSDGVDGEETNGLEVVDEEDDEVKTGSSRRAATNGRLVDDEDENDDDEDADDDDDEDEEDQPPTKRHRPANPFIEDMAEVDDEEDEDEDEDEAEQGFIEEQQDLELGAGEEQNDESHRQLDRQRQQRSHRDAEEQAKEFKERYGRRDRFMADTTLVPKRLLLPSVDDPSIYGVPIARGKGREVVYSILKKVEERAHTKQPLKIFSALERAGRNREGPMSEWVYIEARSKADVLEALDGVMFAYPHNTKNPMFLLPIKEMPDLLRVQKSEVLQEGGWVRIKRGQYAGDVAQIYSVEDNGLELELKVIPRLDYGLNEDTSGRGQDAQKRKRPGSLINRPPPRLFNENEAKKRHSSYVEPINVVVPGTKRGFKYLGEEYFDGYLFKTYKLQHLQTEDVQPTLEEVQLFAGDGEEESLDLSALAQSIRNHASGDNYIAGDTVEIWEGEQKGVWGKVVSVTGDIATLTVSEGSLRGQRVEVPVKGLRKRFKEGDHVKVIGNGRFRDETGMIVAIEKDKVTFVSDMSTQEITVFSKDLRVATDTGLTTTTGKFGLHDLVALDPSTVGVVVKVEREYLRVVDQFDTVRTLTPSQISYKVDKRKNAVATDRNGSEIRLDDTVKEVEGERRAGVILHIHRAFLFLINREQQENSGIIATRSNKVATVAAKGGRTTGVTTDLSRMNPALLRGQPGGAANGNGASMMPPARPQGRDVVIGKTIIIGKGMYKGLLGIVKDANDTHARVELHTKNKIIPIPKEQLRIKDAHGGSVPYAEFVSRGRGRMGMPSSNGVPISGGAGGDFAGGRTPMGSGGAGGRTPAWGAGGRTPAWGSSSENAGRASVWGSGGAAAGARTPAWGGSGGMTSYGGGVGGSGSGGMTSYGGGWQSSDNGGRTPGGRSGMDGGRTPGWGMDAGSKTPGWGMDAGSKTPAYGHGGSGGGDDDDDDDNFPKYS